MDRWTAVGQRTLNNLLILALLKRPSTIFVMTLRLSSATHFVSHTLLQLLLRSPTQEMTHKSYASCNWCRFTPGRNRSRVHLTLDWRPPLLKWTRSSSLVRTSRCVQTDPNEPHQLVKRSRLQLNRTKQGVRNLEVKASATKR